MDTEHIKEFITLAEILNFSKAAKLLHISQSSLSRHMAYLEEAVGTSLIVRTNHNVLLTEAGQIFLTASRDFLDSFENALTEIRRCEKNEKTELGIGILYYQKQFFLDTLTRFSKLYPNTDIHYLAGTPGELIEALHANEVDLCATMHVKFKDSEKLYFKDKYREPLLVMVPLNHPWADRESIHIQEAENQTIINVSDIFYAGYYETIQQLALRHDTVLPAPVLVPDYEDMLLSVQTGKGIAFLTSNMTQHVSNCKLLSIIEEDFSVLRSAAWKKSNCNPAVGQFMKLF